MRVSSMNYDEVCKLYWEVKSRKRDLEAMQKETEMESLVKVAVDTLPQVYAEMLRIFKQNEPHTYERMMEHRHDDDFNYSDYMSILRLFQKALAKFQNVFLCKTEVDTPTLRVPCMCEEVCWYGGNMDRTGQSTTMYFCPLISDVFICDVCVDNYDDFWYDMFETHGLELEGFNEFILNAC